MSARLMCAGRRAPREQTPIASCERLARFARDVYGFDRGAIERELIAWRDRERLALSDGLLSLIAAHCIAETTRVAA